MVTIKVISERGVEDKKIPQCFADLQWIDYVEGICADKENEPVVGVLSALTGIPVDDFELMSIENQSFILNCCSFFWDESPEYIEVPESVKELSIAQGTWQQLIDCESEFTRVAKLEKPQIAAAQMIIKTYANVDIKGMRVPEALGYWSFFFLQFEQWQKRWEDMHNDKPDYNEEAAGIAKVQAFGWFATLHALAKGDVLKYNPILETKASEIYTTLLLEKTEREYSENLNYFNSKIDKQIT